MKKFRCNQWEQWHSEGIDLEKVRTIQSHKTQAKKIEEITSLLKSNSYSILEIGPADGGVCFNLLETNSDKISSYTLVDDKSMLKICKSRLSDHNQVNYIEIENIESLKDNKYDLLVSSYCLEETPREYQELVFNTFFPNVNEIFILANTKHSNTWGEFDASILESNISKYLNLNVSPAPADASTASTQYLYYGSK